jgi:circadian clock protein KaiC
LIQETAPRITTGITGFDEILQGGFLSKRTYLLTGPPGCGKTTLGWHFLTAGSNNGESVLYITFGEPPSELIEDANYLGFDTSKVAFCDLSPTSDLFEKLQRYDIFPAAEVELEPTTLSILEAVKSLQPKRIFIDSMTAMRYLSRNQDDFRRQSISMLRYMKDQGCCILLTSEASDDAPDNDLRFLADGVIELAPSQRARSLAVVKMRGSNYRAGQHTLRLTDNGATVFPRLLPESHSQLFTNELLPWGIPELDLLTKGGLERGTVTLVSGPSGVGKTTLGAQFMKEAAERGERSAIYSFDERITTLMQRCESVNIPVRSMVEQGKLKVTSIESLRFSPDEFADMVRKDVEHQGTKVVMIDSISGYKLSVSDEQLNERLHALCRYLQNVGVTILLINELLNMNDLRITDIGISYLADNVILMRYIENRHDTRAEVGRAIGVLKKRLSDFEKTMRCFSFTPQGLHIGPPLSHLGGILGNSYDAEIIGTPN